MSWNIYIYAEVKGENDTDWKPLTKNCVCDNFKYYKDYFYDEMEIINTNDTSIECLKNIDQNLFPNEEYTIKYCSIESFREHYNNIINTFDTEIKSLYTALGIDLYIEDGYYYSDTNEDTNEDIEESYDNNNDLKNKIEIKNYWLKNMTFPVNKKLFTNITMSFNDYIKALEMLSLCNTLCNMCDNYDDEIRLIFAVM